jgi:uncharacterized protein (DUF58 family)
MPRQKRVSKRVGAPSRQSVTRPTLRGFAFLVGSVVCGVGAYILGRSELLYAAGFLVLLPVIGYLIVRVRPLRYSVVRTFSPSVVTAGAPTVVELSVRNESGYTSATAQWTDGIPWFPHQAGPGTLPALTPGASAGGTRQARLGYSLRPSLRGVYDIGPLAVSYSDPFGLALGRLAVGSSQSLYVIPVVVDLGESVSLAVSGEGSARLVQHLAKGNEDDLMTREYRTGDALRRVHWRASARHGDLMVRQEEQRSFPEARIILDTRSDGYGGTISSFEFHDSGFTWFEWAVTMVASMGVHLHRSGFLVRVLETGPKQIAPLGDANQGSGQDIEFLLSLAGVRLSDPGPFIGPGSDDRAQGALGPVFAVIADPSPETLRWILAQRRPFETGVAFIVDSGKSIANEALAEAGWICVAVTDKMDPALAWMSVLGVTSRSAMGRR